MGLGSRLMDGVFLSCSTSCRDPRGWIDRWMDEFPTDDSFKGWMKSAILLIHLQVLSSMVIIGSSFENFANRTALMSIENMRELWKYVKQGKWNRFPTFQIWFVKQFFFVAAKVSADYLLIIFSFWALNFPHPRPFSRLWRHRSCEHLPQCGCGSCAVCLYWRPSKHFWAGPQRGERKSRVKCNKETIRTCSNVEEEDYSHRHTYTHHKKFS